MATTEEKAELVETLKGPRFYNIQLNGYGGESAYMTVSKEAHDFWQPICEEHSDYDLTTYMNSDGEEDDEYDVIGLLPRASATYLPLRFAARMKVGVCLSVFSLR